jgi:hypothetical protein
MPSDLVERLQKAASAVIANERPTLTRDPQTIKSVVVELVVTGQQQVGEADCYVMRRANLNRVLGLSHGGPVR